VSAFFDKVSWPKVVLVLGGFVLLIASLVLFPDAFERLSHTVLEWARAFGDIFTGGTE
jgi:hypothetical protein